MLLAIAIAVVMVVKWSKGSGWLELIIDAL